MKPIICKRGRIKIDLESLGLSEEQIIILTFTGSRMYGLSTPNSDSDFGGIYLPTKEQLLTNDFEHHLGYKKNGQDVQLWSIYKFLHEALQGETLSIDLLHSRYDNWLIYNAELWENLRSKRKKFYTKNMKSFVSFARKQAMKYGVKGNRINALTQVISFLNDNKPEIKLKKIWEYLPKPEHVHLLNDEKPYKMYKVCGKKFQETVKVSYILESLEKELTDYGKRAKLAANNEGIDWKAISHAYRCCQQVMDILEYGEYKYPVTNYKFILDVKLGKLDFNTVVRPKLENMLDEMEDKIEKSDLPETTDERYWKEWLLKTIEKNVL